MGTSSHAVFNVVSGNVYFVIVIFNIHGQKMRFSESSQNSISEKSIFGHFEVIFSTYRQNFEKSPVSFLGDVVRNIVLNFELSIFKKGGGSRFASRHFPKSVILASCNFVGRPFLACYACSIVIFHSS